MTHTSCSLAHSPSCCWLWLIPHIHWHTVPAVADYDSYLMFTGTQSQLLLTVTLTSCSLAHSPSCVWLVSHVHWHTVPAVADCDPYLMFIGSQLLLSLLQVSQSLLQLILPLRVLRQLGRGRSTAHLLVHSQPHTHTDWVSKIVIAFQHPVNCMGSPQDNQTLWQANAHSRALLIHKPFLKSVHKINSYTNVKVRKNVHTQTSNTFLRVSPCGIAPAKTAHKVRTCWYQWPFCLIYQYPIKDKYNKGMDRHN